MPTTNLSIKINQKDFTDYVCNQLLFFLYKDLFPQMIDVLSFLLMLSYNNISNPNHKETG